MYEIPLNGTRYFDIVLEASGSDYRSDFANGNKIYFYYNSSLEMKGIILKRSHLSTGELRLEGVGYGERVLGRVNAPDTSWAATNTSAVIADDHTAIPEGEKNLLYYVSGITKGNVEDQTVNTFRSDVNQSVLEAVDKLCTLTGQDYSFDDTNDEIDIEDHKGSASSVVNLSDGINIKNIVDEEDSTDVIKRVTVIGKGYGLQQISTSTNTTGWTQGDEEITRVDKSIDSEQEALDLATNLLAIHGTTDYNYSFEVLNQGLSFSLGDVVTLYADRIGISGTELRILKYKRVLSKDSQRLFLTVRGTGDREIAEDEFKQLMAIKRSEQEATTMTQPTDDATAVIGITGGVIAAPSDTDITGDVTSAPSITGVTGSVTQAPSITGVTGAVSAHGSSDSGYELGVYTMSATQDNAWHNVGNQVNVGGFTYLFHDVWSSLNINAENNSGSGGIWTGYLYLRAYNSNLTTYYPDSTGHQIRFTFELNDTEHVSMALGDYIHIAENWTSNSYYLQYKIVLNTTGLTGTNYYLAYSYSGSRGHVHGDSFGTSDSNHPHGDSLDTSDSNHPHGDNFDTQDNNHPHGDDIDGTDSGHFH